MESVQVSQVLHPARQEHSSKKHLAVKTALLVQKISSWLLIGGVLAAAILVLLMQQIEPRRLAAQVQMLNGGVREVTLGEFHERLLFERARDISRQKLRGETLPWYEQVVIDYRYLSSLGFAGGILDRMTRELLLREEASRRQLSVSQSEIEKAIEEAVPEGKSGGHLPSVTGSHAFDDQEAIEPVARRNVDEITTTTTNDGGRFKTSASGVREAPPSARNLFSRKKPRQTVFGVASADLPPNYRDIIGVEIIEKKLKDVFCAEIPHQIDEVKLRLIRFEVESDGQRYSSWLLADDAFETLYFQANKGMIRNATAMPCDWSSSNDLTRDFSHALSTAVFSLAAGKHFTGLIPAARGWYLAKVDGHEVRDVAAEWRLARGEDSFNNWLAHQQSRITQFPLWMKRVPVMSGVPLNQGAAPLPNLPSQQNITEKRLAPASERVGISPLSPHENASNQNPNMSRIFPTGGNNDPQSPLHDSTRENDPASFLPSSHGRAGPSDPSFSDGTRPPERSGRPGQPR